MIKEKRKKGKAGGWKKRGLGVHRDKGEKMA